MEVKRKMKANPNQVFAVIQKALLEDIRRNTGKRTNPEKLKAGYTWTKRLASGRNTRVHLEQWEPGHICQTAFETEEGRSSVLYVLDGNELLYEEISPVKVSLLEKRNLKKRLLDQLDQLDQAALLE